MATAETNEQLDRMIEKYQRKVDQLTTACYKYQKSLDMYQNLMNSSGQSIAEYWELIGELKEARG